MPNIGYRKSNKLSHIHSGTRIFQRNRFIIQISSLKFIAKIIFTFIRIPLQMCRNKKLTFFYSATNERITRITNYARANWIMIDNFTMGIFATFSRARINTFLINACFIEETLRRNDTFWFTRWGSSNIVFKTRANRSIITLPALTVRAAR